MKKSVLPALEKKRLETIRKMNTREKFYGPEYDEITQLAAFVCETPIALISMIGERENWLISQTGLELFEYPSKNPISHKSFLYDQNLVEIPDTRKDGRFSGNPWMIGSKPVIFYVGIPLLDNTNQVVGTLCAVGHKPNKLNDRQKTMLQNLANQVGKLLEFRKRNNQLKKEQKALKEQNEQLKNFAGVVSHDVKMPLSNIIVTIDLLKAKFGEEISGEILTYLNNLKNSALSMGGYVSSILAHYESDNLSSEGLPEHFDLHDLLEDILDMLQITEDCTINFPEENLELFCNKIALEQILLNLINNSVKYNDKDQIQIDLHVRELDGFYHFKLKDNGMGIPRDKQPNIFNLFSTVGQTDRNGQKGNGIGLSTVKKLVENLHGKIQVSSVVGRETTFAFSIKKPMARKTGRSLVPA